MGINSVINSNITVFKLVLDVYHQVLQYWPLLGAIFFNYSAYMIPTVIFNGKKTTN